MHAEDLLLGHGLAEIADGTANEADQNPSEGTPDDASNALANQAPIAIATS